MRKLLRVALAALVATAGAVVAAPSASAQVDVYSTPGYHTINGREWRTVCETYSVTYRCRTEIKATVVSYTGGRFIQKTGWAFNNLTYLSSPRVNWAANPLGKTGSWTATDGRKWRTECDTATTGQNGCRTYIEASVIAKVGAGFQWKTQEIFNSMVRFGDVATDPGTVDPTEGLTEGSIRIADVPSAVNGWKAYAEDGAIVYLNRAATAAVVAFSFSDGGGLDFWRMALESPRNLSSTVVCGNAPGDTEDVCVFTSAKYGIVLTGAVDASRADHERITLAMAAKLA